MRFPFLIECITAAASAGMFVNFAIRNQYVIQVISEQHNYTSNQSTDYCSSGEINETSQKEKVVTDEASRWQIYISFASGLPSIFSGIMLTSWSDKVGRKIPLALAILALCLSNIMQLLIVIFRWPLYTLVISALISGSMGQFTGMLNIAMAHLSDITTKRERTNRYTVLECSMGFAAGLITFATGYWITADGFVPSSWLAVSFSCISCILTIFIQSNPKNRHKSKQGLTCNSSGQYENETKDENIYVEIRDDGADNDTKHRTETNSCRDNVYAVSIASRFKLMWRVYSSESSICLVCPEDREKDENGLCPHGGGIRKGRVWRIWFYLVGFNILLYQLFGTRVFDTMYFVSSPMCFSPTFLGIRSGLMYFSFALAPFLVAFSKSVMKWNDDTILLSSITASLIINILTGIARQPYLVFIAASLTIFSQPASPVMRSRISSLASRFEQGAVLSLISGIEAFTNMFSTLTYSLIYPATLHLFQGFIWFYTAILITIPLTLMIIVRVADIRKSLQKSEESKPLLGG